MSFINWVTEKIVLPSTDLVLNQRITKDLEFLLKSQFWTKEELENYQNWKLQQIVKHAFDNVPYYHDLFKKLKLVPNDVKKIPDLQKLPILTKKEIKQNYGKLIATNLKKEERYFSSSSGSTGEPLQFYRDKNSESMMKATALRGWYWMGFRLGDKFVKLSQNPRSKLKKVQDLLSRNKYLYTQQLDDLNFNTIVNEIINYGPLFLRSYPDPLLFLLNYAENHNIKLPSLKGINTTGNILFPFVREKAERLFDCKIFDQFSCEGGAMVYECPTHECYHSANEYAVTEIVDETGQHVDKGRLITTDLMNYVTPFIRYDTQDIVELFTNQCSCGRGLMSIKKIYGRDSDILMTSAGKYLIVHNFTGYFEWIKEVDHFQVRQEEPDRFDIYLKVNESYTKEREIEIFEYWKNYIGSENHITLNVVEDIPLSNSGKRRFLIRSQNVPINL